MYIYVVYTNKYLAEVMLYILDKMFALTSTLRYRGHDEPTMLYGEINFRRM